MAKDKKEKSALEQIQELSMEAQKELSKITKELLGIAKEVKDDYDIGDLENQLNNMSASITQIHQDSPYLDEIFKGETWKKVIKTGMPIPPIKPIKNKKDDDGKK